jgi:hypothetical protein
MWLADSQGCDEARLRLDHAGAGVGPVDDTAQILVAEFWASPALIRKALMDRLARSEADDRGQPQSRKLREPTPGKRSIVALGCRRLARPVLTQGRRRQKATVGRLDFRGQQLQGSRYRRAACGVERDRCRAAMTCRRGRSTPAT